MPGTPSWPNPRSSPQLGRENGHRSKLRAAGIREGFEDTGYPLLTKQTGAIKLPGVIEIYPHPALVQLFDARKRLPYKASKFRSYWPEAFPADRRTRLYSQWREIAARLEREIAGVEAVLPPLEATSKAWEIKAYEDTLDAIVAERTAWRAA
jgi:predicted RNase H-like nuclease